MSSNLKILLFCVLSLVCASSKAEIVQTYSIKSPTMEKIEKWVDQDTVVFIELDNILFVPKSSMFGSHSPYKFFISNMVNLAGRMPVYKDIVDKWYRQRELKLVQEEWPDFINRLKDKGATIYGLCSMELPFKDIEKQRYLEARNFGIKFTDKIRDKEVLEIARQDNWLTVFYKGVVFTGPLSKYRTLLDLMKITKLTPRKMVIIGNIKHQLEEVDRALRIFNMDYYSVIYLAATELPGAPDPEVVRFQQQQLISTGIWFEDEKAREILKSSQEK